MVLTWKAWRERFGADVAIAFALFLVALLLRLPNLALIPVWADDIHESMYALRVAQGIHSPWVGMVSYTGPIHTDLLALVLKIYPHPLVPRTFNLVLAALTIPATFLFARLLHNRAAGVIAGLLLATASTHIVVNSHYAYSSAATPFFTTLACVALLAAQKRSNLWLLGLAAVLMALAMQTHPVAVAMVPGMFVWFWTYQEHRAWFRRPALYIAGLVTLIAYLPVVYAVLSNPTTFRSSIRSRTYAVETNPSPENYLGNLQNLVVELVRMVGAHYEGEARPLLYLTDPFVLAYVVLVPLSVIVAVRHKRTLPVFALGSSAVIIPFFLYQYDAFPYFTRYVAFLLPLLYVLVGSFAVEAWDWLSVQVPLRIPIARTAAILIALLFLGVLVVVPAQRTAHYYDGRVQAGATNAPFLEIIERLDAERDVPLVVDDGLEAGEFVGGGELGKTFRNWFRFVKRPFRRVRISDKNVTRICDVPRAFLIATASTASGLPAECALVRVMEFNIATRPGRPRLDYGLYEIGRAAD